MSPTTMSNSNIETWAVWPEKKLPNVFKSCPKMILLEKLKILTAFTNID